MFDSRLTRRDVLREAAAAMLAPHVAATLRQTVAEGYGDALLGAMVKAQRARLKGPADG